MNWTNPRSRLAALGKDKLRLIAGQGTKGERDMNIENDLSDGQFLALESCHSIWFFDEHNHRFCRVLKATHLDATVSTEWRDYDHLVIDDLSEAFIVFLDQTGSRLLRAWRHGDGCTQCGVDFNLTGEMSLDDLRHITNA